MLNSIQVVRIRCVKRDDSVSVGFRRKLARICRCITIFLPPVEWLLSSTRGTWALTVKSAWHGFEWQDRGSEPMTP